MSEPADQAATCTGLVLAGGGMRGAYEVGVLAGLLHTLGIGPRDRSPFSIFTGTSVGAINATRLAACADRGDLDVQGLTDVWTGLRLDKHLRLNWRGALRALQPGALGRGHRLGQALLDVGAIEEIVEGAIPWNRLRQNIDQGNVKALVVAALEIASGKSVMFADLAPGAEFRPSRDPRRHAARRKIEAKHVMASAAIPFVFPPQMIDDKLYCDGGLRFNTPIAPAIRCGAEKLVVIAPLLRGEDYTSATQPENLGSPAFLLGKILNALLLDPLIYDLQVLERFNALIDAMESVAEPKMLAKVREVMVDARGMAYRKLSTLVFMPSEDIGQLAAQVVRQKKQSGNIGRLARFLVTGGAVDEDEADLASYFLFDGEFAEALIALGRADALGRKDEILAFFADP